MARDARKIRDIFFKASRMYMYEYAGTYARVYIGAHVRPYEQCLDSGTPPCLTATVHSVGE